MFIKSRFFRSGSLLVLALALGVGAAFADTIRLKDGSVIKGKIVSFGGGRFTVLIDDGARKRQLDYTANEVESISFDANSSGSNTTSEAAIGSNNTATPQTTTPKPTPTTYKPAPATTPTATAAAAPKPITINVSVLADNTSNGWTNSGFVVQKGQRVRISGSGRVSLGGGRYTTPEGIATLPDANKLMAKEATGALIAVIGDDNNEFILIGNGREFTATRDGALFFGVNEGNLDDNSGLFSVKLDVYPNR